MMEYNVYGEKVSRARWKEMTTALKRRQEIIAAGLSRRDLFKMGLLTQAGMLVPIARLSARAPSSSFSSGCYRDCGSQCAHPATPPCTMQPAIKAVNQP